jgi:hypothetical protein
MVFHPIGASSVEQEMIYGVARRFIKTYSGRKRYNVLDALNFVLKKVTTVTHDTYITAVEICGLLQKAAVEYAGKPIYIVLDNARYQKCNIVQELAKGTMPTFLIDKTLFLTEGENGLLAYPFKGDHFCFCDHIKPMVVTSQHSRTAYRCHRQKNGITKRNGVRAFRNCKKISCYILARSIIPISMESISCYVDLINNYKLFTYSS